MSRPNAVNSLLEARLYREVSGATGPRLLLLHAIGFDLHTWDPVRARLAPYARVAAVDLPGHGYSDKPEGVDYGLRTLGRRMLGLLEELRWPDAVVVGNSLGGGVALAMAVQQPERVRGLVLVNSVGYRIGLPPVGLAAFLPMVPLVSAAAPPAAVRLGLATTHARWNTVKPERVEAAAAMLRARECRTAFFRTLRQLYGPELDLLAEQYPRIHCPAWVVHGMDDPLLLPWHARRLAHELPRGELRPLPECGHFPPEECPDRLSEEVLRFLQVHSMLAEHGGTPRLAAGYASSAGAAEPSAAPVLSTPPSR